MFRKLIRRLLSAKCRECDAPRGSHHEGCSHQPPHQRKTGFAALPRVPDH